MEYMRKGSGELVFMTVLVSLLVESAAHAENASERDESQFPHGAFQSSDR
jgi:hypothetical protein